MCVFGQLVYYLFCVDDFYQEVFWIVVQCGLDQQFVGFYQIVVGGDEVGGIGNMFDDFQCYDYVIVVVFCGQCFGGGGVVVDVEFLFFGMQVGYGDIVFGGICFCYCCVKLGQWFGYQFVVVVDIEDVQFLEWQICIVVVFELIGDLGGDIFQLCGVQYVQWFEFVLWILLFGCYGLKFGDFGGVDVVGLGYVGYQVVFCFGVWVLLVIQWGDGQIGRVNWW